MNIKVELHNKWDVVVTNTKTGKIKKGQGKNIVLNAFWARYISSSSATSLSYIHVGEGTATPVPTNTKLTTPFASYASANEVIDTSKWKSDGYITRQLSCRIEANTQVGKTISEVGFAYSGTTTGNLVTHSLIKDMNGNALTITIGADEVVDIFGTVFFKIGWRLNAGKAGFTYDSLINNAFVHRLICKTSWGNTNTTLTAFWFKNCIIYDSTLPPGQSFAFSPSYNVASKKVTYGIGDVAIGSHNYAGGILGINLEGLIVLLPQTGFLQPPLVKEVIGTGDGIAKDFSTKFGFLLDNSTFVAYVNDVEVVATADYNMPVKTQNLVNFVEYMESTDGALNNGGASYGSGAIFRNPWHQKLGIDSFTCATSRIYASEDGQTWIEVGVRTSTSQGTVAVPSQYKNYEYWKVVNTNGAYFYVTSINSADLSNWNNIHLASMPAIGDTISVTYQPNVIAKDASHTLKNVSVSLTFAEYTPV